MNVGEVLDKVEQTLLCRQLNSLERFILSGSWVGRGYSEMALDCAYSIAHIKDIGSQLWQALSKAIGQRVTKKNLFLVLEQYLFSQTIQPGIEDRVQDVERREDEDCNPTLSQSSQLTLLPLEQDVGMARTAPMGGCQNSFTKPATPHPTAEVSIPPQLNTVSVNEARLNPAGGQRPADEEPLAQLGETVTSGSNSVTLELAETIDPALTPENTEIENILEASLTQSESLSSGSFCPEDQPYITHPSCHISTKSRFDST